MMEKQIEEMAKIISVANGYSSNSDYYREDAEDLYNAGYRKQEWISVEERLPVIQGKYLVYTYDRRMFMCDLIDHYCNGDLQFDDYRVTHWMPLPQPPQMKGAE